MRYGDFTTVTRSHTVSAATRDADDLAGRALALLDRTEAGARSVRLLGVTVKGFPQEEDESKANAGGDLLPFADD